MVQTVLNLVIWHPLELIIFLVITELILCSYFPQVKFLRLFALPSYLYLSSSTQLHLLRIYSTFWALDLVGVVGVVFTLVSDLPDAGAECVCLCPLTELFRFFVLAEFGTLNRAIPSPRLRKGLFPEFSVVCCELRSLLCPPFI